MAVLRYLRSLLWTLPLVVISTIAFASLSVIIAYFDRTGNRSHELARVWARLILRIGFVHVETEGLERLDPSKPYVLVSNHTSYYDTPAIIATIPLQFRFFAKKGLFQIPFMGTHLTRAGHFPVDRDDPRNSVKSIAEGARQMRERKLSVLLFPEGGRSEHTLREFKEGAAHIAIRAQVPAVPVGITGARQVLAMHTMNVIPGTIRIYIGEPIQTAGMAARQRHELTQLLLERVAELTGDPVPAPSGVGRDESIA